MQHLLNTYYVSGSLVGIEDTTGIDETNKRLWNPIIYIAVGQLKVKVARMTACQRHEAEHSYRHTSTRHRNGSKHVIDTDGREGLERMVLLFFNYACTGFTVNF